MQTYVDDYWIPEAALDVMIFDDELETGNAQEGKAETQGAAQAAMEAETVVQAEETAATEEDDLSFMEEESDLIDFGDDDAGESQAAPHVVPTPQSSYESDWDRALHSIQI